jgi:regulatory factor X
MLPTDDETFQSPMLDSRPAPRHADGRIYADAISPGFVPRGLYTSNYYKQNLSFLSPEYPQDTITLPNINLYAPLNHDADAASALNALYRSHCTSLVDCIRFCKEKQFFRLFTSFSGTLTVPVQKLFVNPAMATWIKECDWLMYQNMLHCLSNLILQVLPLPVTKMLDTIAKSLTGHITRTFQGHPVHVLEAKLEPATLFSELVSRLLIVNSTAHAAADAIEKEEHRAPMAQDWVYKINPKRLMESELPWCGHEEAYKILTEEIIPLLEPVPFMDLSQTHYRHSPKTQGTRDTSDSIIDRIGTFVRSIPSRFPNASPSTIVDCVKNLGTAAMRQLTITSATSFHAWWLVKIFVDEMIQWLASSGGFLAHRPLPRDQPTQLVPYQSGEGSQHHSRYSSIGADFAPNGMSIPAYQHSSSQAHPPQQSHSKLNLKLLAPLEKFTDISYPVMMPSQNVPVSFDTQFRPANNRKRSSTDVADSNDKPSSPDKRMRIDHSSQPQFEHHASFNSSFGSAPEARTDDVHDLHDDSGIGLGIMDEPFSLSTSGKEHTGHPQNMSNGLDGLHASLSQGHVS